MDAAAKIPTWSEIGRTTAMEAAQSAPYLVPIVAIAIIAGYVIAKHLWPWLQRMADQWLATVRESIDERKKEREADAEQRQADRELFKSSLESVVTETRDGMHALARAVDRNTARIESLESAITPVHAAVAELSNLVQRRGAENDP